MNAPLSLDDFYRQTLSANGIELQPEPVEKVAEARGVDPVVAKIAKAIFDQTRIDNIQYETPKARLDDAFKIASAYVAYMDEAKTASTKLAADLLRVAQHAIEGYLAHNGVTDISAADGVKIAAICVEEAEQKVAEPGSDFVMRMMAARKAKKAKGSAPEAGETAAHEAGESKKDEKAEHGK